VAQSVERLTFDFSSGHDLRVMGSSPKWGSKLGGGLLGILSPPAPPPCAKIHLKKKSVQFSGISLFCNHYVCLVPKLLLQKMTPASISNSPSPGQPWTPISRSVLCGFALSGHFTSMESYSTWPFVADFFHSACFRGASMLYHVGALYLFTVEAHSSYRHTCSPPSVGATWVAAIFRGP